MKPIFDLKRLKLKPKFSLECKNNLLKKGKNGDEKNQLFRLINKKPVVPLDKEIEKNPSSRSAKLRFAIKEKDVFNFEKEILEKFNYLLEIESLSRKL